MMIGTKWKCNCFHWLTTSLIILVSSSVVSLRHQDSLIFGSLKDTNPIIFNEYVDNLDTVYRRTRWPPTTSDEDGIFFPIDEEQDQKRRYSHPTTKPESILSYPGSGQMEFSKSDQSPNLPNVLSAKREKDETILADQLEKFISWAKTKGLAENFVEATPPPKSKTNYFHLTSGGILACPENYKKTSSGLCEEEVEFE